MQRTNQIHLTLTGFCSRQNERKQGTVLGACEVIVAALFEDGAEFGGLFYNVELG